MKAEQYLIDYMLESNISMNQVEVDMGINLETMIRNKEELRADDFVSLCIYLGVNPDDVMNTVIE